MKICIFGTGAVGTHLAARLASAALSEISIVARGAQLAAIRARGVTVLSEGREISGTPTAATDDAATLPPQDIVVVTLKATALPAVAETLARLCAPGGTLVFAMNGIPWWWHAGRGTGGALPLLDPDGKLWSLLRERSLGCVISSSNILREPGVAFNAGGRHLTLGEFDDTQTPRLAAACEALSAGGFGCSASDDIRGDVWRKLCINAPANPIGALTRLPQAQWRAIPQLYELASAIIDEVLTLSATMGWDLRGDVSPESILGPPGPLSATGSPALSSMLQDVLAGRPLEVDAILGQICAFGEDHAIAMPSTRNALGLLRGLDVAIRRAAADAAGAPAS